MGRERRPRRVPGRVLRLSRALRRRQQLPQQVGQLARLLGVENGQGLRLGGDADAYRLVDAAQTLLGEGDLEAAPVVRVGERRSSPVCSSLSSRPVIPPVVSISVDDS